jgi:hypothetical protein
MASEASPLENNLVAFVEGHPETFNSQDVVNLRRKIIAAFAVWEFTREQGVGHLVSIILDKISDKFRDKTINTSQDVTFTLTQFDLCVDFLKRFLMLLCNTQVDPPHDTRYSRPISRVTICHDNQRRIESPQQDRSGYGRTGDIWSFVNKNIDEYQVRVLKLWADILVHNEIIKPEAIAETRTAGYNVKYDQLREKWGSNGPKPNLDESILLEYLTLVYVATPAQMLAERVSYLVFSVISQFVPFNMVNGTAVTPPDATLPTGKHNSELNMMRLTCNVVYKPYPRTPGKPSEIEPGFVQSPIFAYLSSDMLDKCVQTLKHFPTTEEFLQARMVEKMGAAALPPPPSAPPLSEFGGGGADKKTRRKENKKRKYSKKSHRRSTSK